MSNEFESENNNQDRDKSEELLYVLLRKGIFSKAEIQENIILYECDLQKKVLSQVERFDNSKEKCDLVKTLFFEEIKKDENEILKVKQITRQELLNLKSQKSDPKITSFMIQHESDISLRSIERDNKVLKLNFNYIDADKKQEIRISIECPLDDRSLSLKEDSCGTNAENKNEKEDLIKSQDNAQLKDSQKQAQSEIGDDLNQTPEVKDQQKDSQNQAQSEIGDDLNQTPEVKDQLKDSQNQAQSEIGDDLNQTPEVKDQLKDSQNQAQSEIGDDLNQTPKVKDQLKDSQNQAQSEIGDDLNQTLEVKDQLKDSQNQAQSEIGDDLNQTPEVKDQQKDSQNQAQSEIGTALNLTPEVKDQQKDSQNQAQSEIGTALNLTPEVKDQQKDSQKQAQREQSGSLDQNPEVKDQKGLQKNVKQEPNPIPTKPANPQDLWKNIPTDESIPYYKQDESSNSISKDDTHEYNVIGASLRGRSHAHVGKPRDDHFDFTYVDSTNWLILIVADGAGSAEYSREGSKIACETILSYCKTKLEDPNSNLNKVVDSINSDYLMQVDEQQIKKASYDVVANAANTARKAIQKKADNDTKTIRDFATTSLIVITKKCTFGQLIISLSIGDGAIVCLNDIEESKPYLMSMPDSGEYAGQTHFLTMSSVFQDSDTLYKKRLKVRCIRDYKALLLMTDGVSDPFFDSEDLLLNNSKWDDFWKNLTEIDSNHIDLNKNVKENEALLLKWLNFYKTGHHDDRTIVVMYK